MNKDASCAILTDRGAVPNVWMQAGSRVGMRCVCGCTFLCVSSWIMNVSEFYAGNKNMLP